jgi:hypothetical protein
MPEPISRRPLARRGFLSGGAAFAASAVLAAPTLAEAATRTKRSSAEPTAPVVVRWNSQRGAWAKRPADADFGVIFLSTNDPHATPPTDAHMQAGDVWRRHPDAKEL